MTARRVFFPALFFFLIWGRVISMPLNDNLYVIGQLEIVGNKVTREKIILRELSFRSGDTLVSSRLASALEESRNNLLNTSLFNYVTIDTALLSPGQLRVTIRVEERWYTWPMPIFELADRNFNVWWKSKDFSRTHYGFYLIRYNFRGRKETLTFRVRLGYSEQYRLAYTIPYINRKQTSGLRFSFGLTRSREVSYQSNLKSEQEFYSDESDYPRQSLNAELAYNHRRGLYNTHSVLFKYNDLQVTDTVVSLNPDYLGHSRNHLQFLSVAYVFKHDRRDFKPYPLRGHYLDFELVKMGLGLVDPGNLDYYYATGAVKGFLPLGGRWFGAGSMHAKLSSWQNQPYSLQQGLGFGSAYVRAYELQVVDGQNYWLTRSNLKYNIIPPMVRTFPFVPSEKFNKVSLAAYLNAFLDMGYVLDLRHYYSNPLTNSVLAGYGLGLDIVTYYDKVMRIEYARDRFGENGIFLHFTAPI